MVPRFELFPHNAAPPPASLMDRISGAADGVWMRQSVDVDLIDVHLPTWRGSSSIWWHINQCALEVWCNRKKDSACPGSCGTDLERAVKLNGFSNCPKSMCQVVVECLLRGPTSGNNVAMYITTHPSPRNRSSLSREAHLSDPPRRDSVGQHRAP